ncbi:MerR family transcriptional regulator [Nocardioides limicola]|uniref:MerR family transcriptional regulator n=1 Tax=Nocardioides limicola TaxID=2803368 RepID=UPI001EEFFF6F|nr:MerR family transcriptional regulator [Nocardioides sp. DJM-14]
MSELAERSGTPVPTIKYYLREGLLPPGEAAGATRSRYVAAHVDRLRLIRALVEVAGLRLDQVRDILAAIDDSTDRAHAIGAAHRLLSPAPPHPPTTAAQSRVAALLSERGWLPEPTSSHAVALAAALDRLDAAGLTLSETALAEYADAAGRIASTDLAGVGGTAAAATAHAVVGTLLVEPVLLALRRLAQEDLARRRLGD